MATNSFRINLLKLLLLLLQDDDDECIESSSEDINILLLGPTGVGKTTFINAFMTYLVSNTLDEAINVPLEAPIPAWFNYTDPKTYDDKMIIIGEPDDHEKKEKTGESCTRASRSFVFVINGKRIRFIDTPGVGDTRGILQDEKNFEDLLAFINQFHHLNGICLLFKPDDSRATLGFRFNVRELFRRLHTNAKNNLMFVFSHSRSTFFKPGETVKLIRDLLEEWNKESGTNIPFNSSNTFLFDNEPFRFLALHKNGISHQPEEKQAYSASWKRSFEETKRLLQRILGCEPHKVRETVSLNQIQQTIRKLSRPVAEVSRLIEQNKKLIKDYLKDPKLMESFAKSPVISQLDLNVIPLDYPRTVSTNEKFTEVVTIDGLQHINYTSHCHEHCYLRGVEEELVGDPKLKECVAIDDDSGLCKECKFSWKEHMHITYEIKPVKTQFDLTEARFAKLSPMKKLELLIEELGNEQQSIIEVSAKLLQFLRVNTLCPINDSVFDYMDLCLKEEREKKQKGEGNDSVIFGLEKLRAEYEFMKKRINEINLEPMKISDDQNSLKLEEMERLIESLYELPHNGKKIKAQIKRLEKTQIRFSKKREKTIDLAGKVNESVMCTELSRLTGVK